MNIRVEISGPVMGDIRIARETPDGCAFDDGPDRDAEEAAQMLERIAGELRRMFSQPEPALEEKRQASGMAGGQIVDMPDPYAKREAL